MKNLYAVIVVLIFSYHLNAQSKVDADSLYYYGISDVTLEGTVLSNSEKESYFDRLPISCKKFVRPPVWESSKYPAGMSIRFFTDSRSINVKWSLDGDTTMNHFSATAIKGVDLYYLNDQQVWQYLASGRPESKNNKATLISQMPPGLREYKLYLPLYEKLNAIMIGVEKEAAFRPGSENSEKPIVFYGTSITQGGCASRPGMAHTNIISRKLGRDCINFGFSANGRMEKPIANYIASIDAACYVIECVPNMTADQIEANMIPMVETIRKSNQTTPIIFVEGLLYDQSALNISLKKVLQDKNTQLHSQYDKLIDDGHKNLFYIVTEGSIGNDHEATVDGVHFTDLGFIRYAQFLIDKMNSFDIFSMM